MPIIKLRSVPKQEQRLDDSFGGTGKFREYVFARISKGDDVPDIAKEVGIGMSTLYSWLTRWREEAKPEAVAA